MAKKNLDIQSSITPSAIDSAITAPVASNIAKSRREIAKEKLQELIKEESKLVKGIFKCFETPGASVNIIVKKYPGIPHFEKTMTDGSVYEIPLYVARHLNGTDASAGAAADPEFRNPHIGTCSYPVHGFIVQNGELKQGAEIGVLPGHSGIPVPMVGVAKRVQRFGFQSLEFAGV